MAYCTRCGSQSEADDVFCRKCGANLQAAGASAPELDESGAWAESNEGRLPEEFSQPAIATPSARKVGARVSRKRLIAYLLVSLISIGALIGFAGSDVEVISREAADNLQNETRALANENTELRAQALKEQRRLERQLASFERCRSEIGPLVKSLQEVDARLDVGLSFAEYGTAVGDLSVAYDRISPRQIDAPCLKAAVPAEDAFNSYTRAYNVWNDCIGDINCSLDSVDPQLQTEWLKGSSQTARARRSLQSMNPY